jgi:hypothetical protein
MTTSLIQALTNYATRFHAALPEDDSSNSAASPLGSWMLLASLATSTDFSTTPDRKAEIENALGMTVEEAGEHVAELRQNKALNYVSQVWYQTQGLADFPVVNEWINRNTLEPAEASIPSQGVLDAWASEHTHGLIKQFPMDVDPDSTMFMMANVIYSKLVWEKAFNPALDETMSEAWNVEEVLHSNHLISQFYQVDGKMFISTIVKADNNHEQVRVVLPLYGDLHDSTLINVAYRILAGDDVKELAAVDVADEPGILSRITRFGANGHKQDTLIPAWEAESTHDLFSSPVFGYTPLAEAFTAGAEEEWGAQAAQSVVAKFEAKGFEAAAVTAFSVLRSASMPQGMRVVLDVKYGRKFAFVSTVDGIPVFSGIVRKVKV